MPEVYGTNLGPVVTDDGSGAVKVDQDCVNKDGLWCQPEGVSRVGRKVPLPVLRGAVLTSSISHSFNYGHLLYPFSLTMNRCEQVGAWWWCVCVFKV